MSKELQAVKRPDGLSWEVRMSGGGSIPSALEGLYTNVTEAEKAIRAFQESVRAKVDSRGKGND